MTVRSAGAVVVIGFAALSAACTAPAGTIMPTTEVPASAGPVATAPEMSQGVEFVRLRERVETLTWAVGILLAFITVVLGLGAGTSLISWWRQEGRSKELHTLTLSATSRAQRREDEIHDAFMAPSIKTLGLVNTTLDLANRSTQAAQRTLEEAANATLRELDRAARKLLEPAYRAERILVEKPELTVRLHALADEIAITERLFGVIARGHEVSAECTFVRAMAFHLKQNYEDAIEFWDRVATDRHCTDELKILATYWSGYECNNVGDFAQAVHKFGEAQRHVAPAARAGNPLWYELRRIQLESRLFNGEAEDGVAAGLDDLLQEVSAASARQRGSIGLHRKLGQIAVTLGNAYVQNARQLRRDRAADAASVYEQAIVRFRLGASQGAKYAHFGLAEALHQASELTGDDRQRTESRALFANEVMREAENELATREEHRTRVLSLTTQLYCLLRTDAESASIRAKYDEVNVALGHVDDRLTIYSQRQNRNVKQEDFRRDLQELVPLADLDVRLPLFRGAAAEPRQ